MEFDAPAVGGAGDAEAQQRQIGYDDLERGGALATLRVEFEVEGEGGEVG